LRQSRTKKSRRESRPKGGFSIGNAAGGIPGWNILFALRHVGPPAQANAQPAAILINEFDPSHLKGPL